MGFPRIARGYAAAFILGVLILSSTVASQLIGQPDLNLVGKSFGVPGNATFDYIVVGGGTAGNAIATRLAQKGSYSVAVVEAGGFYEIDNGNLSAIPAYSGFSAGSTLEGVNPRVDWGFVTPPQTLGFNAARSTTILKASELTLTQGLNGRQIHVARGKCLGGSSARNFFFYHYATKGSYSKWAQTVGDSSYEFDAFEPYLAKGAHFTQANNAARFPNASYVYDGHTISSAGGPLQVTLPSYGNPAATYMIKGLEQLGLKKAADFVSGILSGVNWMTVTQDPKDMTRSSSETSYLRTALAETGLQVYHNTMAKRVLFNGTRAASVLVDSAGLKYTLAARKEVVLSAGAFQSPQLLMVSGVGARAQLASHGIPLVADRFFFFDWVTYEIYTGIAYPVNVRTHAALADPAVAAAETAAYLANPPTGLLTNAGSDFAGWEKLPAPQRQKLSARARTALAAVPSDWPELEYAHFSAYSSSADLAHALPPDGGNYLTALMILVAPMSSGNVTITSADTADLPLVNPNYLGDPTDQELYVAGIRRMRELVATPAMRSVITGPETYPGANVTTDAQILEFLRKSSMTVYHPACTAKMGKADDPMAVVDSKARVLGVQGLRVVDASAFPFLPPGHPQATIYGLAEKIAHDMLAGS